MTRDETEMIFSVLEAAYPRFYRQIGSDERRDVLRLWFNMFEGDEGNAVGAALKAFIAMDTKGFPPSIGQIKEKLVKLKNPGLPDEAQAWVLVHRAIQNSGWHAKEEFDKLPPIVQKAVGHSSVLKDWAMQDQDEVNTVIASNFQRAYRARVHRAQEELALPENLQNVLKHHEFTLDLPQAPDLELQKKRALLALAEHREQEHKEILGERYDTIKTEVLQEKQRNKMVSAFSENWDF